MSQLELRHDLSGDLNAEQYRAVTHDGGPCLVLAGAGSGKTRVITHRIAWLLNQLGAPATSICAVTFTNKAAGEMRSRVQRLAGTAASDVWVLTFHALGLRILRDAAGADGAPRPGFAVYDRGDALAVWRRCQTAARIDPGELRPTMLYEMCSRARSQLQDPRAWDDAGRSAEERAAAQIYERYCTQMRAQNAVDFDDLLALPLQLLSRGTVNPDPTRFRHLLVDEYQDTNRTQYRLVRTLLDDTGSLMVVGDEDQSIYRWRGADIANVLEFRDDFPNATIVRLEQNYRSTQPILAAAGSLVSRNSERLGKQLWTDNAGNSKPIYMQCATERCEAVWIAKRIATAMAEDAQPGDMAVLYRTNAQSRPFEEELTGRGIPFRVLGGQTFFRRAEVKDVLAYLRLVLADDDAALARAVATPARGVGPANLASLRDHQGSTAAALLQAMQASDPEAQLRSMGCRGRAVGGLVEFGLLIVELRRRIDTTTLGDLIELVMARSGYRTLLRSQADGEDRLANVDELVASAVEFADRAPIGQETLASFLDRTALISDADTTHTTGVALMTVHSAKGLEFSRVFVAGLEEGLFPLRSAIDGGQVEEERRLAYVAMTRARHELFLSSARMRRVYGRERFQLPSRFIGEIDSGLLVADEEPQAIVEKSRRYGRATTTDRVRRTTRASAGARRVSRPVDPNARGSGIRASSDRLGEGTAVFHPMFGGGRITQAQGSGDSLKLTVEFARAGTKQLIAKYAKLELLA